MLPPHLQERIEPGAPPPREGAFVVYWMRIAARADENPALDVALLAAKALKKPVFVYHSVSQRYRYASDRLHTFLLEGARDVQRACAERGVGYAFHLEREPKPVLKELIANAALVRSPRCGASTRRASPRCGRAKPSSAPSPFAKRAASRGTSATRSPGPGSRRRRVRGCLRCPSSRSTCSARRFPSW
jgi:hypothetical protein